MRTRPFTKVLTILFASTLLLWGFAASAEAQQAPADSEDAPQVIGVLMYADWCGSCQVLDPKLEAVKPDFSDASILFTQFDRTDDFTTEQSRLLAKWTGLDELFSSHDGTGYMVLIDAETQEELARLTRDQSEDELRTTIAQALDRE